MKSEDLLDAIGEVRDETLRGARPEPFKRNKARRIWAAAACLCLAAAGVFALWRGGLLTPAPAPDAPSPVPDGIQHSEPEPAPAAAQPLRLRAVYPAQVAFPDYGVYGGDSRAYQDAFNAWSEQRRERNMRESSYLDGMDAFLERTVPAFLGGNDGENAVCSPLNVYLALAEMAEITDGESRAQVLALLGSADIETSRRKADDLWFKNYMDDGATASILASSLWLRDDTVYDADTLQTLADVYRSSVFSGEMGGDALNGELHEWINEQTGGLLREQAGNVTLTPDTALELVTTIYFRAKWLDEFSPEETAPAAFHAAAGDQICDFMNADGWFYGYRGAHFFAASKSFDNAGSMWFLLPDEGVAPETLLSDPEALSFLSSGLEDWDSFGFYWGRISLPKFDVSSDLDLLPALRALGVTDAADAERADYTPLLPGSSGVALGSVEHAARVTMDERGVEAAAFTAMGYGMGGPDQQMDFILDRPFLFAVTGADGLPLFVGVVNRPVA